MPQGSNTVGATVAQQKDVDLIRKTFKDKDGTLLKSVRALFFGIELTQDEKERIKAVFSDTELLDLFQRRFLPNIKDSKDLPLGQMQDIWLGAEQMVFGANPVQIQQAIEYKEKAEAYTKHALTLLTHPDGMPVQYERTPFENDPLQIGLLARNMYLKHIDQQLMFLHLIANQEEESEKQKEERHIRNSTK